MSAAVFVYFNLYTEKSSLIGLDTAFLFEIRPVLFQ